MPLKDTGCPQCFSLDFLVFFMHVVIWPIKCIFVHPSYVGADCEASLLLTF